MERKELELHQDKLENEFHAERFAKWLATSKAEWRAKQEADSEAVAEGHLKINIRPQRHE